MTHTIGRITIERGTVAHTCPDCMRGLPCQPAQPAPETRTSSLSALVAFGFEHYEDYPASATVCFVPRSDFEGLPAKWPSDTAWKRGAFRNQADGFAPDTFPQETM